MTFFAGPTPRQFAHRGASGTHPENTMAAFAAAAEAGAQGFELDIHLSSDGEIVVHHDATLDRTTDGTGPIADRKLAELVELDAGFHFSPDGGRTFPFRGQGVTIPTLGEILEAFPAMPIIIEIKADDPALEERLARLLHKKAAAARVLVFSLGQAPLDRYRALKNGQPTGFGPNDVGDFLRRLGSDAWEAYAPPAIAFAVPVRWHGTQIVSAPFVQAAHDFGCEVLVWTVNEARQMDSLLDLGVDGLISDYPERLRTVVGKRATH